MTVEIFAPRRRSQPAATDSASDDFPCNHVESIRAAHPASGRVALRLRACPWFALAALPPLSSWKVAAEGAVLGRNHQSCLLRRIGRSFHLDRCYHQLLDPKGIRVFTPRADFRMPPGIRRPNCYPMGKDA